MFESKKVWNFEMKMCRNPDLGLSQAKGRFCRMNLIHLFSLTDDKM